MKSVPTLLLTLLLTACGTGAAPVTSSQPSKPAASPSSSAGPSSSIPSPSASASPAASAATKPATSTSPSSPGSSAASANASPAAKPSPNGGAQSDDWPFYHKDLAHTGVGPASPALNQPKQEWSAKVDAAVYAEPLVQGGRVYVVTENDTAYALDAGTGSVVWQKHLGDPVPRSALPCGNIDPSGITATPALAGGTLYAVGRFQQPQIHHELWAVDAATGNEKFHRTIDPQGADPRYLQERSAVSVNGGHVYVAFGGNFGDCGPYKGWVLSAPADGASGSVTAWSVPTQREGAIWAPPGPTFTQDGDLLVAVGNAESTSQFDYGNAVVRLSADLQVKDYWAPADWAALSRADRDIGSISPTVVDDNQVFQSGKNGFGYLLNAGKLGQVGGEAFKSQICSGAFSGTAYQSPMLYVPCTDGLVALRIGSGSFDVAWHTQTRGTPTAPIVAYGSIWQIEPNAPALLQLDPASGQQKTSSPLPGPSVAHFLTPTAAGGKLFATSGPNVLAFGGS